MGKRNDSSDFMVRYTNKDIMDKLELVHQQTLETNGRVTKHDDAIKELADKSVGVWVSKNSVKFAIIVIFSLMVLISDSRDLIVQALLKLI